MVDRFTSYDIMVSDIVLKVKMELFLNSRLNKDISIIDLVNDVCSEIKEYGPVENGDRIVLYKNGRIMMEIDCQVKKIEEGDEEAQQEIEDIKRRAINVDDLKSMMDAEELFKNDNNFFCNN